MLYDYNLIQRHIKKDNAGKLWLAMPVQNSSLGDATQYGVEAGTVISMLPIPGAQIVGPIIGAISSMLDSVFGWGDTTPMTTLNNEVVQMRLQIADLHKQMGIPDTFEIPPGMDPSNEGEMETLSLVIANDFIKRVPSITLSQDVSWQVQHDDLGTKLWPAYVHTERADMYKTLAALKAQLQTLETQAGNAVLTTPTSLPPVTSSMQSTQQIPVSPSTPQPSSTPASTTASLAPLTPFLLLAGAGILLMTMRKGD